MFVDGLFPSAVPFQQGVLYPARHPDCSFGPRSLSPCRSSRKRELSRHPEARAPLQSDFDRQGLAAAGADVALPSDATAPSPSSLDPPTSDQPNSIVPDQARTPANERFKVRDGFDNCVVARLHGRYNDKTALILPDGELGFWNRLVPTDEPFRPLSANQLQTLLHEGPYAEYNVLKTEHYLVFYRSSLAFAQDSGRLLDGLYKGLIDAFRRNGFPVHDTEFPLVAVIFATESDFRRHKDVDRQVQAYYEFFSNRIFFYQKSDRDQIEPKLATLLKPQTVAHEGRTRSSRISACSLVLAHGRRGWWKGLPSIARPRSAPRKGSSGEGWPRSIRCTWPHYASSMTLSRARSTALSFVRSRSPGNAR